MQSRGHDGACCEPNAPAPSDSERVTNGGMLLLSPPEAATKSGAARLAAATCAMCVGFPTEMYGRDAPQKKESSARAEPSRGRNLRSTAPP